MRIKLKHEVEYNAALELVEDMLDANIAGDSDKADIRFLRKLARAIARYEDKKYGKIKSVS